MGAIRAFEEALAEVCLPDLAWLCLVTEPSTGMGSEC